MILRSTAMAVWLAGNLVWAQSTIRPHDRLTGDITGSETVTVLGNIHPALARARSVAAVDASFPMEHMILLLQPAPAQQEALDSLVAQQQDPQSSQYHHFLSPDEYAARFGVSQNDIEKVTGWLKQQGFQVEEVTANHLSIIFSGDAYAVQTAFKTEVKQYSVNGQIHHANSSDPQIPAALASVVKGVVKLHDFQARSYSEGLRVIGDLTHPLYTASPTTHYIAPADWALIYDVKPLYASSLNGNGQSIAVVARSNVKLSDLQTFRSQFGLSANNPTVIVAQGSDPGFTNDGDSTEATLDAEWANAVAPNAQVKLVISGNTATADGIALASQYAVNHNVAPVLSVSYGSCESDMGSTSSGISGTELAFYNMLWQQAASQGISVFVAAGDSGAAGCESPTDSVGTQRAVNGICSSPYVTCVGGTQFKDTSNPGQYWLGGNNAVLGSAQSYIPEVVWNESALDGGSGLAAGGGGASAQFAKPSWQIGPGVPADSARDVPDVAVSAASHDAYLIYYNGALTEVGGTSASTPSFASLFTIINQKYNSTQGLANPVLYPLALKQSQAGAAVFHDIKAGDNTVPGTAGYSAGVGYDLASGLGSVDALLLVNHWRDVSANGTLSLTASPTSVSIEVSANAAVNITTAVSNGFNWPVTFAVSGLPSGVTAAFIKKSFPEPGSGATSLQFAASGTAVPGTYPLTVTASGGGVTQTLALPLTVTAIVPKCDFAASLSSISVGVPQGTNLRLTCTLPKGALPAALTLAVSGLPTGVTGTFAPTTLVPATGVSTLTISTVASAVAGSYTIAVTASGGSFSQTLNIPLKVVVAPNLILTLASSSVSVVQATPGTIGVTLATVGPFNAATTLAVGGLPVGMTGSFSTAAFAAPGAGASTLTLTPSTTTPSGRYSVNVIASGGGLLKSVPLVVTVTAAPNFMLAINQATSSVQAGLTNAVLLTVARPTGGFNSLVTFSASGLPTGVTAAFSAPTLAAPGTGTSTVTLSALTSVTPGQYKVVFTAAGGVVSQNVSLLLTVLGVPGFTLATDITSLSLTAGATFTTKVTVVPINKFNSPVSLSLGTLPAGITGTFSTTSIAEAAGSATLTIQTASTLVAGPYNIAVMGTSSSIATALPGQTATIALSIGTVSTALSTPSITILRGTTGSVTVTTTAVNFTNSASFTLSGYPPLVSYAFSPSAVGGSGSSTLTITVGSAAQAGTYTLSVRTNAGGTTSQTPLTMILN